MSDEDHEGPIKSLTFPAFAALACVLMLGVSLAAGLPAGLAVGLMLLYFAVIALDYMGYLGRFGTDLGDGR